MSALVVQRTVTNTRVLGQFMKDNRQTYMSINHATKKPKESNINPYMDLTIKGQFITRQQTHRELHQMEHNHVQQRM
jgi:hypothetical protein